MNPLQTVALAFALLIAALAIPAVALEPGEMFEDPAKEARARAIGRNLRCLVCDNQSIFDSNAGLAADLRVLVRERIEAGDDDDQVIAHISELYGDYVLLEPPVAPHTYALWAAPVLFLVFGALWLRGVHREQAEPPAALDADARSEAQALLNGDRS